MKREIIQTLNAWKTGGRKKPLLLTGVRQCGKTHALKEKELTSLKRRCSG
ncbi:hypothetical protein J6U78_00200 [bacterium]|nr:hypothetical protein [bacterium]